ncbi:MAG: cupin domain-containing protein [Rhizobiaceae bacterium]|jgi:quercetin dioxygenase-like cupin family protein|nr:cupin domain-containing protein [Rhizobiaceae bacterium]
MSYKSSPRPVFDQPTLIRYQDVTRHVWGDAETGLVDDWIYASTDKIHQLVFGLAPGKGFRHSKDYRTVFGADELLVVLSGVYGCANPETGEVRVVKPGEAIFFRKDTWHHGYALTSEAVRVLEFFAPPPSTGTSGAYARTRPYVETATFTQARFIGNWPMGKAEERATATMHHLRDDDMLWTLDTADTGVLTGLYASTEHLTAGKVTVQPGAQSSFEVHGGDECLYVTEGVLNVHAPDRDGQVWFEAHPGDGFFVPAGHKHRYMNMGGAPASFIFGVAPRYRA